MKKMKMRSQPSKSKSSRASGAQAGARGDFFGFPLLPWITRGGPPQEDQGGRVLVFAGSAEDVDAASLKELASLEGWQAQLLRTSKAESLFLATHDGPLWVICIKEGRDSKKVSHDGLFKPSLYSRARDLAGPVVQQARDLGLGRLSVEFILASSVCQTGFLVGLEMGAYRFIAARQERTEIKPLPVLECAAAPEALACAASIGQAVNMARHLVNLPAADLSPASFSREISRVFGRLPSMEVRVWDREDVRREGMGLLAAVGEGSVDGSHLVLIRYRPTKPRLQRPIALVGKGVTFDTGGLDLKPASAMRLMKKDMGGSAAMVGLAWWLHASASDVPCDIWLALAENAVDERSFRPGDILKARNGMTVEIHNTDAEGRLVMADAFDMALTTKEEPLALIDVATLTGAMRVSVGTALAGMFASDDLLATEALAAGARTGDLCWRQPLFEDYRSLLKSNVADIANASDSPFAGAVTAALFLQRFVRGKPWLHFDAYCWSDRAAGALAEPGGNGQTVQMLADFLDRCQPDWFPTGRSS